MLKTYRTIRNLNYSVGVKLPNGKKRYVEFTGGTRYPRVIMPYFMTGDERMQKALENSPSFNVSFILEKERENIVDAPNAPDDGLEEKPFPNVNGAKDFFKSEPHKIAVSKLATKAAIISQGKALGFDVKFEND